MAEPGERSSGAREFGRDGVSGMVDRDRAIRAHQVSQPRPADLLHAEQVIETLVARATGKANRPKR